MAKIVNLTAARNINVIWDRFQVLDPSSKAFTLELESTIQMPEFKTVIQDRLSGMNIDEVDFFCFIIETYYSDLAKEISTSNRIHYVSKRIQNCLNLINGKPYNAYEFAFPKKGYTDKDPRVGFLVSVLDYVDLLDKNHETIQELLHTPLKQYQQIIQFISFFPHPKIPMLLEQLSYFNKYDYVINTISPIGNFKSKEALNALLRLEAYYKDNPKILSVIYNTKQKFIFNIPRITP